VTDPVCGAARHLTETVILVCTLRLSEHAGLNHHDPQHGVWWQKCDPECSESGHVHGRVRYSPAPLPEPYAGHAQRHRRRFMAR